MHTFFLKNIPPAGAVAELEKREKDHLFKTLRCRTGEMLRLCDGAGTTALAEAAADRTVKILERVEHCRSKIEVHLFTALPKNAKIDELLKPVTEAGVVSITPLKCRYSVSEKESVPERWFTLMEEACKQSGNPFMPQLNEALGVAEALEYCKKNAMQIFYGAQHGACLTPADLSNNGTLKMAWMVGPEGGFDENEQALLNSSGRGISLGEYIFRLENAALAGVAYLYTTARAGTQQELKQ